MDFFDLPLTEQRAAIQREKHASLTQSLKNAQQEIQLLRSALNARQRATPGAQMTPAEIRLRAFEQARAARCRAAEYKRFGNQCGRDARKADEWRAIAGDFERAAARLTQPTRI